MAGQAGNPVNDDTLSPNMISHVFIHQYYHILHEQPDQAHKFYQDSSILSRPESNGTMVSVTTLGDINRKIMSMDLRNCITEIETADAQLSHKDGVFIIVTGSFTSAENICRRFTQSFFLAPQESGGYFVLNDVFRFLSERNPSEISQAVPQENESSQAVESNVTENVNNVSVAEKNVNTEPPVQVAKEDPKRSPVSPPAPAPPQTDIPKTSYASLVKVMKEVNETTPSVAKNNSSSDEQGYSIYVKGLPFNSNVRIVEEEFKKFGAIKPHGVQVLHRKDDGFSFGFVEYLSPQSMEEAIQASPILLGEKEVYVEEKRSATRGHRNRGGRNRNNHRNSNKNDHRNGNWSLKNRNGRFSRLNQSPVTS